MVPAIQAVLGTAIDGIVDKGVDIYDSMDMKNKNTTS